MAPIFVPPEELPEPPEPPQPDVSLEIWRLAFVPLEYSQAKPTIQAVLLLHRYRRHLVLLMIRLSGMERTR